MKLSKKTKMIILIALVAALTIGACTFCGIRIARNARIRSLYANYEDFSTELTVLIDFLKIQYPANKNQPTYLRVADGKALIDPQSGFVRLPDEISQLLTVLHRGCFTNENAKMYVITFHGSRIQFDIENGSYALVYSPDGEPEYLHQQGEDFPILVKHIEGDWYHVSRMS